MGFQLDGGVVTHTVTLDGLHDGQGGVDDFGHFTLPGTFVNLTSVQFTGLPRRQPRRRRGHRQPGVHDRGSRGAAGVRA
ncbi:MAG: hypothetical protein R2708_12375 [Vicinamibacterales bacterium]